MRLSDELQIVYTASHWALELKPEGGLFAVLDIIYLLNKVRHSIRWEVIFDWVQHQWLVHMYLILSYLNQNGIIELDRTILAELFVAGIHPDD